MPAGDAEIIMDAINGRDKPIQAKYFLEAGALNKLGKRKQEMYNSLKKTSAFYVIKLPACNKAIKFGRSNTIAPGQTSAGGSSQGILHRIGTYTRDFGNCKILYILKFKTYADRIGVAGTTVSTFERRIKEQLTAVPVRGKEYFPISAIDELKILLKDGPQNFETQQEPPIMAPIRAPVPVPGRARPAQITFVGPPLDRPRL
jgi:hypothetical protein